MTGRMALLSLVLLAGCASSPEYVPGATSAAAPAGTPSSPGPSSNLAASSRPALSSRPSDWALSVVGTPFVLAFRAVVCAASLALAAPAAALVAVSDDPRGGYDDLRDGLAQNCGPPYVVPVPYAYAPRYGTAPAVGYSAAPEVGQPRRLTPYYGPAITP